MKPLNTSILLSSFLFLFITACASTPPLQQVPSVDESRCELLGTVSGTSMVGKASFIGSDNAMFAATEQAKALKATHLVWTNVKTEYDGTLMQGKAYKCRE